MNDPLDLRVSDAERERVAERLRAAAGEGRLTVEELDERVERAYGARTAPDLETLTADLPASGAGSALAEPGAWRKPRRWLIAIMSGSRLRGRWRAGRKLTAFALMGGDEIDLRGAELESRELTITAVAIMGGIDVIVPRGFDAELTGFALMGGNDLTVPHQDLPLGAPRVHVRAFSLMGGVDVKLSGRDRKELREGS